MPRIPANRPPKRRYEDGSLVKPGAVRISRKPTKPKPWGTKKRKPR